MKIELTNSRLVEAMMVCFFGDGPRYAEIIAEANAEPEEPDDTPERLSRPVVTLGGPVGGFTPMGNLKKNRHLMNGVHSPEANRDHPTDVA